jgi:isopentenyl-diphosphate Delta-isomerase
MIENIYYVDEHDSATGEIHEKLAAHNASTKLHAAFSCYVFNDKGQFLVTQRAHTKKVWHGVWTNTCCGHPAPGESREDAITRRLKYELGMTVQNLQLVLPEYIYKTPPYNGIIEHEYCPVYIAIADSEPVPNPDEVEDYKWVEWKWFLEQTENDSNDYSSFKDSVPDDEELGKNNLPKWSWWCKDQLNLIKDHPLINEYSKS